MPKKKKKIGFGTTSIKNIQIQPFEELESIWLKVPKPVTVISKALRHSSCYNNICIIIPCIVSGSVQIRRRVYSSRPVLFITHIQTVNFIARTCAAPAARITIVMRWCAFVGPILYDIIVATITASVDVEVRPKEPEKGTRARQNRWNLLLSAT
jgi:hypothetical protein